MDITIQKTDEVSSILTVKVVENDYSQKVIDELKHIGRTHQIPGFRKGHVSIADLKRRFGRQVTSDVINQVVFEAVMKYIEENKLNVLGQPMPVEVKELDLKNEKEFTFQYELGIAPELNVKLDKDEHIAYYNIEISDEMVEEQDKAFRKRFGAQVPGEEFESDALVKGTLMELNADGSIKEGEDAIQVNSAIVAPFYFQGKEEAEKFNGKKVGDKVVFNPRKSCEGNVAELSSMLNISKERAAEVEGDFELAIAEIIVVRPAELGEEYYNQVFGAGKVSNEEEYKNALREMIARELKGNSEIVFRMSARKFFMEKYGDMQLPDAILKKWLISRNEELTEENIDEEYGKMVGDLKWQLVKEQIAKVAEIKIEESDLMEFARSMASRQLAQYGMPNMDEETIDTFAKNILGDKNYRPRIVEQVGDIKLFEAVQNAVSLDTKNVSFDEFKAEAEKI